MAPRHISPYADPLVRLLAMGVLLLLGSLGPRPAAAQTAILAASESKGMLSEKRQAQLYEQLERETEFFQKQAAVVRTVAKLLGPSVVHVEADVTERRTLQHGHGGQVEEAGSGVIVGHNGKHYVLTNCHVVRGSRPEAIRIQLADRRWIGPSRVWTDVETDVAVMAIDAPYVVDARLGNSDAIEVGDFVLTFGSPFGLSHSVTFGIVSAKNRRDLDLAGTGVDFQNFIQTDAAINPGNSGGPLINLHGEVVGINTAIASSSGGSEGIGFAIPVNTFINVARQLVDKGRVDRAFLGVTIDSKFGPAVAAEMGLPRPIGARITAITAKSPAAAADLRVNDVVLQYETVPVEDDAHLVNLISLTEVGKEVSLVVFRDRQEVTIKAKLAAQADFASK
jgi:serine protease Do